MYNVLKPAVNSIIVLDDGNMRSYTNCGGIIFILHTKRFSYLDYYEYHMLLYFQTAANCLHKISESYAMAKA